MPTEPHPRCAHDDGPVDELTAWIEGDLVFHNKFCRAEFMQRTQEQR